MLQIGTSTQLMIKPQVLSTALVGSLLTVASACQEDDRSALLDSATLPLASGAEASKNAAGLKISAEAEQALRRNYGAAEMKLHECTTLEPDGTLTGKQCPSAFVVFGPYVTAPASSNLHLRFDVQSPGTIFVSGDLVSNLTRQFHGSFGDQMVEANRQRTIDYKINLPLSTEAVEARIFIHAEKPSDFKITNFIVGVE
jgi:hypothetical protein